MISLRRGIRKPCDLFPTARQRRVLHHRDRAFVGISTVRLVGRTENRCANELAAIVRETLKEKSFEHCLATLNSDGTAWELDDRGDDSSTLNETVRVLKADSAQDLLSRVRGSTSGRRPVEIYISEEFIVFAFSHAFVDGSSGSKLMAEFLERIFSAERFCASVKARNVKTSCKFPMLRAAAKMRIYRPVRYAEAVRVLRKYQIEEYELDEPHDTSGLSVQVCITTLDLNKVREFKSKQYAERDSGFSVNSMLTAEIISLLAGLVPNNHEMTIAMPIDCRRYVNSSRPITGNFAPAVCVGRLGEQWTPELAQRRIAAVMTSGAPIAAMLRGVRYSLFARPASTPQWGGHLARRGQTVTISHIKTDDRLDNLVGAFRNVELATTGRGPVNQGISIRTERFEKTVHVTITDDSNLIDCRVFNERLSGLFLLAKPDE